MRMGITVGYKPSLINQDQIVNLFKVDLTFIYTLAVRWTAPGKPFGPAGVD